MREAGGAWSLVFASDARGIGDPPTILLPCGLLEQMEHRLDRAGTGKPLLFSGRAYHYRGRRYLLPTWFQVPRERTPLHP